MLLITTINRTVAREDGSELWIDHLFVLELVLIAVSYVVCILGFYMLCKTTQYHPNLTLLMQALYGEYLVQKIFRIILIVKMLTSDVEVNLSTDRLFIVSACFRTYLVFIAFYFSIFAMIERSIATVFIRDYEINHRKCIGFWIAVAMFLFSFSFATLFVFGLLPIWYIEVSFFVVNFLALVICHLNGKYNKKKLKQRNADYSLSERYQVAENLRTAFLFKRGIAGIIFFNICCCSFLSVEVFEVSGSVKNWMYVGFNYAVVIYGLAYTASLFYYNEMWREEFKRLTTRGTNRVEPLRRRAVITEVALQSKSVETDLYFTQLVKEWDKALPPL